MIVETDELIGRLSANVKAIPASASATRLGAGAAAGAAVALGAMTVWLGLRPDFAEAVGGYSFWMKGSYTVAIAAVGLLAALRLSKPESRATHSLFLVLLPIALLAALAAWELAQAPASERLAIWLGSSARECPLRVLALSAPVFAGLIWSFRRFAPASPALAGGSAGLAAGAIAATVYGLHCQEHAASFVLTWYTFGIMLAGAVGAAFGRYFFRW